MVLLGISLIVVALDQLSKFVVTKTYAMGQADVLIPGWLNLALIHNPGAAFGFMSEMDDLIRIPFFVAVTIAAGFMVYAYHRLIPPEKKFARVSLGLVWGGALGNFVDRILYGKVIDFLQFGFWTEFPIFNVADSCISVGLTLLVGEYLLDRILHRPTSA